MYRASFLSAEAALGRDGPLSGLAGSPAIQPTICPQWLRAWYTAFADPARDPILIAERSDGGVAGYLALARRRTGQGGIARDLWSTTNGHSQYCALWCEPGAEAGVMSSFLAALAARRDWDRVYLQGLPQAWIDRLVAGARDFRPTVVHRFDNRMVTAAQETILPEHLPSSKTLRKLRGLLRQLSEKGDLQMIRTAEPEALGPALERYMAAERSSWKAEGGELLGDQGSISAFYRGLTQAADATFRPEIWTYAFDGRLVAGLILIRKPAEWVTLKLFYDADFAHYALGRNLMFAAIAAARDDPSCCKLDIYSHWSRYDDYASHTEPFGDLVLWNRGPRAALLRSAWRLRGRFRRPPAADRDAPGD